MSSLADFHFLRPLWLMALLPCALLLLAMWRYYRPRGNWQQVIDPELLPQLTEGRTGSANRTPLVLILLAWLIAIIALAGPSWQKLPQPAYQKHDALIILFDLSPSMYAGDIKPSRLERAKREIRDVLQLRQEGLTALVAYAGDAHVVTPLTDDTETIELLLPSLAPAMMPSIGNQPLRALELAAELAASNPGQGTRVLFVTDDIPSADFSPLQRLARKHKLELAILAVGTPSGAPIPLTQGGFLKNSRDEVVVARLNDKAMENWAASIGARYHASTYDDSDIEFLLRPNLVENSINPDRLMDEQQQFDVWRDAGPWLVLGILPFALLAFRRGWLLGLVLLGFVPVNESYAFSWRDLWQTEDQQAQRALAEGEPELAAELFEDQQWQGVARYRAGDYPAAAEAFAGEDSSTAHYNRGNALARAGELQAALQAYDRALELDPENSDAANNRKVVEEVLKQQEQQQQQQSGDEEQQNKDSQQGQQGQQNQDSQDQEQQQQGNESGEDQSSGSGEQDQQAEQDPGQQGEQQDEQETQSPETDNAGEQEEEDGKSQQQQAAEEQQSESESAERAAQRTPEQDERLQQWLRQIPDEPGDLLQRKFDYQYRQQKGRGGEAVEERY